MLNTFDVVYLRRPDPRPRGYPESDPDQKAIMEFVDSQWRALLRGLQIAHARWINPIPSGNMAEAKIAQLHQAKAVGFLVPETLVTNDLSQLQDFAKGREHIVVKALDAPLIETSEGTDFIYTQLLDPTILSNGQLEKEIRTAPAIYQQAILDKVDVRVTIIGEKVFAAEIRYKGDEIDWRRLNRGETKIEQADLPRNVQKACIELLRSFGLTYGAIDLAKHGYDYFFLELNPSGEWGWLQFSGLPIAAAIADVL